MTNLTEKIEIKSEGCLKDWKGTRPQRLVLDGFIVQVSLTYMDDGFAFDSISMFVASVERYLFVILNV